MNTNNKPLSRILAIVLSVTVFVAAIVVPASAATYAERWTNVFDYSSVNDNGSNEFTLESGEHFFFSLPGNTIIRDIDIVFRSSQAVSSVRVYRPVSGGKWFDLKVVSLGSNLYRAFGDLGAYSFEELQFYLTFNSANTSYGAVVQCRYSVQSIDFYNVGATVTKDGISGPNTHSAGSDTSNFSVNTAGEFFLIFDIPDWKKYDFVDFGFNVQNTGIDSISAYIGDRSIPVIIESFDTDVSTSKDKMITGYLDVYGVDHDGSNTLSLLVKGTHQGSSVGSVWLSWLNGSVKLESPSVFALIWNSIKSGFQSVGQWLSDGFNAVVAKLDEFINGSADQQQAAEDFKESAGEQSSAISGAVDAMDVNRPDVNTDVSVSGITGGLNLAYFNAAMITATSSGTVYQILIMTAALMLVSYVLFGKKI